MLRILPLAVFALVLLAGCPTEQAPGVSFATSDLAGEWRLTNESTWNEITVDESGVVVAAEHPHGVSAISGRLEIDERGNVSGWYTVVDEESLTNIPPQSQGTWALTLSGTMGTDKRSMELSYELTYAPQGDEAETYTGTWSVSLEGA